MLSAFSRTLMITRQPLVAPTLLCNSNNNNALVMLTLDLHTGCDIIMPRRGPSLVPAFLPPSLLSRVGSRARVYWFVSSSPCNPVPRFHNPYHSCKRPCRLPVSLSPNVIVLSISSRSIPSCLVSSHPIRNYILEPCKTCNSVPRNA